MFPGSLLSSRLFAKFSYVASDPFLLKTIVYNYSLAIASGLNKSNT